MNSDRDGLQATASGETNDTHKLDDLKIGKTRRKKGRFKPKGRQLSSSAVALVESIFAGQKLKRESLIEYLHILHDRFNCLRFAHLHALANMMKIPGAEIYETASFYDHFNILDDDEASLPPVTIWICDSLSCMLEGSQKILSEMQSHCADNIDYRVVAAPCMGNCANAPAAMIQKQSLDRVSSSSLVSLISDVSDISSFNIVEVDSYPIFLDSTKANGHDNDYLYYRRLLSGELSIFEIMSIIGESGLRGLGGAGFPSIKKWEFVRAGQKPRYLCVNADEGEPGTFKDRHYLENKPHKFLEGALIAAYSVSAERIYIYLRNEYPKALKIIKSAIKLLVESKLIRDDYICLRRGAGAYICGEESAMIESLEGKRGLPRHRPPYVAQNGLFGRPTLVHNVETLYWLPIILERGAKWFASQGKKDHKGFRSYSVSGRVKNPGLKIAPAGISVNELIADYCDGIETGHVFKAYLPGGASGGILPASLGDIPLDFGGQLEKYGCFVGSHAIVILSEHDSIADVATNLMQFFRHESCGQCTPCRCGTEKATTLMQRPLLQRPPMQEPLLQKPLMQESSMQEPIVQEPHWKKDLLIELASTMQDASICGLGQAAANPLLCAMKFFPQDCGIKDIKEK